MTHTQSQCDSPLPACLLHGLSFMLTSPEMLFIYFFFQRGNSPVRPYMERSGSSFLSRLHRSLSIIISKPWDLFIGFSWFQAGVVVVSSRHDVILVTKQQVVGHVEDGGGCHVT